ncbi:bifunctional 4-hydroxy-2-oxoglutarate aldolase/2-dehydro-3-deoxy-phosphogluconate aldolase [Legionella hackeliae]|uniref:2-dehydro-3-deoxy-phosphogluconate aldolase n=1 Tax=Legionella hackeliae TaxID=449 RepID=A0A0A8UNY3_LEGHA|nr:bifunctional 4-hydroxy-2-oxoglutarate aldolase/2-dehydro-3-deoxy-phosphogluconate aldolase [Legionella hackeliae]KTD13859.1 2-deydro-3-deoxyphosphogluconate aldolase/4-hydroxy-2-oxoglutarate aldolase [Legionella hackeliae]CEK10560.1 KHG/KDPG aldolase [Includes: 4-hydroxy-2-oxoglutarate aldolase; 2-dehydro-3-deoxy-phosphogluconate aldolase] [Legionella hackeliae]STX47300.1 2-deydro-3-deoxyphosphogluconate aldolase/4-hydroxy-2-oxoglutarate aldolase [Legionella hackeliae]
MTFNHFLDEKKLFSLSPVIPVIVLDELDDAIPIAKALLAGGIKVLEVTLRTPVALECISLLRSEVPEAIVGAGTVTGVKQFEACISAEAQFVISPGLTLELLQLGRDTKVPYIPGASSVSELMEGIRLEYTHFKFFPAEVVGGIPMLKAIYGPLPQLRFCATGGINEKNYLDYLSLPNVECVGGSWIVPADAIQQKNWHRITELAANAVQQATRKL